MSVLWIQIYVLCVRKTVFENIIYVNLLTLNINANYRGVEYDSVQKYAFRTTGGGDWKMCTKFGIAFAHNEGLG